MLRLLQDEQQIRQWLFEEMTHNENQSINQVKFYLVNDKNEDSYDKYVFGGISGNLLIYFPN